MNPIEKDNIYDVVIIGGGPAALTAAIYSLHGNLKVAFIEKDTPGGKLVKTDSVKNYPGFKDIHGADLAIKMLDQTIELGAKFIFAEVIKVEHISEKKQILTLNNGNKIKCNYLIIATGMLELIPPIDRIRELEFKGVSYCAICDGSIYKNQEVAVIGGGDSAVDESIYLSSVASKVNIFVRKNFFRANKITVNKAEKINKIKIHKNTEIIKLLGKEKLDGIVCIDNNGTQTTYNNIKAVFPYIGSIPQTKFIKNLNITNKTGYIIVDKNMETNVAGIFAAGDVIEKSIRQISTAVNDGAIAAKTIINKSAI